MVDGYDGHACKYLSRYAISMVPKHNANSRHRPVGGINPPLVHRAWALQQVYLDITACTHFKPRGVISCDSQSCFREVETVNKQTYWNVPDRVDPLDSLVGIDIQSSRKRHYGMVIHIPSLPPYWIYQSQERVTNRFPCLSATNLEDPTTQLAFSFHNFLCNKQLSTS